MKYTPKQLLAKAQITIDDLVSDGGYLKPQQAKKFIISLIEEASLLPLCYVQGMTSKKMEVDKIVFGDRILHRATSAEALPEAKRSKFTTDKIELDAQEFKAEVRLPWDVVEDNIEGDSLKSTVLSMMQERVALDMDEIIANGDTDSDDPDLAVLDGIRKQANSNIVDAGGASLGKVILHAGIKTMPKKYRRNRKKMMFLVASDSELNYRNELAERATGGGDRYLVEDVPVMYSGSPLKDIPVFPENLGVGNDRTEALYLDPKNIRVGVYKKVRLHTDEDISAGVMIIVARVRFDTKYTEEQAVVKIQDIAS